VKHLIVKNLTVLDGALQRFLGGDLGQRGHETLSGTTQI
jgi:hypothetical protein